MTLIEVLISMALMGIVMTALVNVNISSTRASSALQTRNDLLPESQIAQNYVLSKIREATYVFPEGTTFNLGSDVTVQKPGTSGGSWTVGTDPIVAIVLPPTNTTPNCSASAPSTPDTQNCYTFYAYYPVLRSSLTGSATLGSGLRPVTDVANDSSAWVLMEYRASYGKVTPLTTPDSVFTAAPGVSAQGRLVMDYLLPVTGTGTDQLFDQANDAAGAQAVGNTSVTMNLAAQRVFTGQTIRLPSSGRYNVTVYPRNVGKNTVPN